MMKNIYWIRHAEPSKLAIVSRPRGGDWLEDDLAALKRDGINVLVSLLTDPEAKELGLSTERKIAEALELRFISYPIPDRATPSAPVSFRRLVLEAVIAIQSGKRVEVHCRGCIGRATVTTAAVLVELGWSAEDALALIEESRGCPVPDTLKQRDWIQRYASERPGS